MQIFTQLQNQIKLIIRFAGTSYSADADGDIYFLSAFAPTTNLIRFQSPLRNVIKIIAKRERIESATWRLDANCEGSPAAHIQRR